MKSIAVGHIDCHVCSVDAEVKLSPKSGFAYTYCPNCNVQSFARNQYQHDKLIAKMRPVTVAESAPPSVTVTEKIPVAEVERLIEAILPPVAVKKSGFNLGNL